MSDEIRQIGINELLELLPEKQENVMTHDVMLMMDSEVVRSLVVISQPGNPRKPAVRPWFGTYFDRRSKNAADQRILPNSTIIRFTDDSQFEVTFPDGHQETWNPNQ